MTDSDVDGLPDSVEVVIGTDPANNDTDHDLLTDYDEIWDDLDPLERDTNRDGLPDYYEVTTVAEQDVDGDGLVNAWDFDNDGDGVNDVADLSPFARSDPYESFHFEITTNGTPTYLTFQLRPENPNHLKLMEQVWDWPNDEEGLMRDMDGSQEDVTVVPVLNLTLPAQMLPDPADVIEYGIRIEDHSLYVPLAPVKEYGTIVAFSGKLFYPAASGPLNLAMDAQLFWRVVGQTDSIAKALTAHNGENVSVSSGGALVATSNDFLALETFQWIDLGNNQVALKAANGLYVSVSDDNVLMATSNGIGVRETFDVIELGANQIALNAHNGWYVSVAAGGALFTNSSALTAEETFDVIHLGYLSEPITLAIYQEPFMLTGFLAEENYGTDIGVFSSANENHTQAANLALDFDYLRNATIHLTEMPPLLEAKYNVSVTSDIRPFAHSDVGFLVLALNMTSTALDSLPPAQVLPLITAVEDRVTSIDLVELVPSSYVLGNVCAVDLAAGDLVTSKTLKMDWYNTTSYVPLTLNELLTEVQSWGLEEQATDTLMGLMRAWHTGLQTITQIGEITPVFEMPDPDLLDSVVTETSNGVTYTAALHSMTPWLQGALKGGATWGRIGTALNAVAWVVCAVQVAVNLYTLSQILGSSEYSFEEQFRALQLFVMQTYYAILLVAIGMIPYVGWAIVLVMTLTDLLGATKGWSQWLMTQLVELTTDFRYLTQFEIEGGEFSLTLEDPDQNRLDVGDRIVINSTVSGTINATEYGDWEDISASYVKPSYHIWVPLWSFSNTSSFKQVNSTTTDNQTYITTQYDLGVSIQPGLSMPNFPVKLWLSVDYRIVYEEGEYPMYLLLINPIILLPVMLAIGWEWHTRLETNTTESEPTTLYFDVLPGTITDFATWRGILQHDHDGDGLSNSEESKYGTHSWKMDTDSDNLSDKFEVDIGTDPTDFDTDGDGLPDWVELMAGTNATQRDSDSDGLPDYVEVKGWVITFNFSDSGHEFTMHVYSDPNCNDTDHDGLSDLMEYWSNLNPRSRDTNGDGTVDGAQPGVETRFEVEWQTPDLFNNPKGVAIDPNDGNIFVADTGNHQIQQFDDNSTLLDTWGSWGAEAAQFQSPYGISVDSQGTVYVADTGNDRIQLLTSDGTFLSSQSITSAKIQLTASDATAGDFFGQTVALSPDGNTLVVGVPSRENNRGAVYVFQRVSRVWLQQARLIAWDGVAGDSFGQSVAVSGVNGAGDVIAVGTPGSDSNGGAVYVFRRVGAEWQYNNKVTADSPFFDPTLSFGWSVALFYAGTILIVGAPFTGSKGGEVYAFKYQSESHSWVPAGYMGGHVWNPDGKPGDKFGWAVAGTISMPWDDDMILAVGAPGHDNGRGAVFYYGYFLDFGITSIPLPSGEIMRTIAPDGGAPGDHFGWSVALKPSTQVDDYWNMAVGAPGDNDGAGSVYMFSPYLSSEPHHKRWTKKLHVYDGTTGFGASVVINENVNTLVVSNLLRESNQVNVFQWDGVFWNLQTTVTGTAAHTEFLLVTSPIAIDASEEILIFGNPYDNTQGNNAGAVYVYQKARPWDIAVGSTSDPPVHSDIYVSCYDAQYDSIRHYTHYIYFEKDWEVDWLDRPWGVAVEPTEGTVYVADYDADRIVKFDTNGTYIEVIPDGLSNPQGIAVDSQATLYVADTGNNQIKLFDPNGMLLTFWNCSAPPQDVAVDSEGHLYALEGNSLVKYSAVSDPVPDRDGDGLDSDFESNGWDVTFTNATGTYTFHVTSDPLLSDTDFDGLTDFNESMLDSNPRNPDTDSDGVSDLEEWVAGTNLNHYDTDLDSLDDGVEITYGSNATNSDTDDDGLTDREEFDLHSNPTSNDTDGDGLSDRQERDFNSSLLSPDTDGDLMFDGAEAFYNTDPQNSDTDGDNLSDGDEMFYGTDPKNNDTDGDGLLDGMEVEQRMNPKNNDTDGDGTPDGTELEQGTNPLDGDTDGDGIPDSVDDDSGQLFGEPIILAYDPSEEGAAFAETLAQYAPVTVVSLEELEANYTEAPYIVLVGRPDAGSDSGTVGNLSYELLVDTGEVLLQMQESDVYRLVVRYGQWTPTQTIVLLSHPYPSDHFRVLTLLMRQTVTIQPDSALVEYHGSLMMKTYDGETMGFFMVAELDTVKATDTLLFVLLEEDVQPWVELSRYNASTTPVALTPSSGLEGSDKAMDKYLNITVSPNLQNATADLIASAAIQLYYTEADLDRTGDGDANDPQDFNESTLGLYWLNESSGDWIKLSAELEWVNATGVNTTDVELYGESYAGYIWAAAFHFSVYGIAGQPNDILPPEITLEGVEDGAFYTTVVTPQIKIWDQSAHNDTITLNADLLINETGVLGEVVYTLPISEEGEYTLEAASIDVHGNGPTEVAATFTLDWTPPEAVLTFNPGTMEIEVYGIDNLDPEVKVEVEEIYILHPKRHHRSFRSVWLYTLTDDAGNSIQLTLEVRRSGNCLFVDVLELRYNGGAPIKPPKNFYSIQFVVNRWTDELRFFRQTFHVKKEFHITSRFYSHSDETKIIIHEWQHPEIITMQGLRIVNLVTDQGELTYQLPIEWIANGYGHIRDHTNYRYRSHGTIWIRSVTALDGPTSGEGWFRITMKSQRLKGWLQVEEGTLEGNLVTLTGTTSSHGRGETLYFVLTLTEVDEDEYKDRDDIISLRIIDAEENTYEYIFLGNVEIQRYVID